MFVDTRVRGESLQLFSVHQLVLVLVVDAAATEIVVAATAPSAAVM